MENKVPLNHVHRIRHKMGHRSVGKTTFFHHSVQVNAINFLQFQLHLNTIQSCDTLSGWNERRNEIPISWNHVSSGWLSVIYLLNHCVIAEIYTRKIILAWHTRIFSMTNGQEISFILYIKYMCRHAISLKAFKSLVLNQMLYLEIS